MARASEKSEVGAGQCQNPFYCSRENVQEILFPPSSCHLSTFFFQPIHVLQHMTVDSYRIHPLLKQLLVCLHQYISLLIPRSSETQRRSEIYPEGHNFPCSTEIYSNLVLNRIMILILNIINVHCTCFEMFPLFV